jgi:Protein of unknown function (DUF3313)
MTMRTHVTLALSLLALIATSLALGKDIPENWDGLVRVKGKRLDAVYVAPGADFRSYTKVMIDPPLVAFRKNWMRDINDSSVGITRDVTDDDAKQILEKAKTGFTEVFNRELQKAGVTVVTEPAADVLRLSPAVVDLYVNAPDTMSSGMSRTYTMQAGEATLLLEARDSVTNALLGRALDRRETQGSGVAQITSSVTNIAEFERLFSQWAKIAIKGFGELKELSPVPADVKPMQKL